MKLSIGSISADQQYDLVIACCGYESRSRNMIERKGCLSGKRIALGYGEHEELAFAANVSFFVDAGFEFVRVSDKQLPDFMERLLGRFEDSSSSAILLDISCFTRVRLAQIMEAISEHGPYLLDVFYSLADFSAPIPLEPPNEHLCPVTPYFAGWTGEADKAVGLVCGLGYEQLKALGIMEYIDPFETWLFFPDSSIARYDSAVEEANTLLLREVARSNIVHYPVLNGTAVMRELLALTGAIRQEFRCILMPLGPKIFAFAALLVGSIFRDVSVWRASSGRFAQPRDRRASGDFAEFRVVCGTVPGAASGNRKKVSGEKGVRDIF